MHEEESRWPNTSHSHTKAGFLSAIHSRNHQEFVCGLLWSPEAERPALLCVSGEPRQGMGLRDLGPAIRRQWVGRGGSLRMVKSKSLPRKDERHVSL